MMSCIYKGSFKGTFLISLFYWSEEGKSPNLADDSKQEAKLLQCLEVTLQMPKGSIRNGVGKQQTRTQPEHDCSIFCMRKTVHQKMKRIG